MGTAFQLRTRRRETFLANVTGQVIRIVVGMGDGSGETAVITGCIAGIGVGMLSSGNSGKITDITSRITAC